MRLEVSMLIRSLRSLQLVLMLMGAMFRIVVNGAMMAGARDTPKRTLDVAVQKNMKLLI